MYEITVREMDCLPRLRATAALLLARLSNAERQDLAGMIAARHLRYAKDYVEERGCPRGVANMLAVNAEA